jgi:hypothetical protein
MLSDICVSYLLYLDTHGVELREHLCQQKESLSRLFCTLVEATVCIHLNVLLSNFHLKVLKYASSKRTMSIFKEKGMSCYSEWRQWNVEGRSKWKSTT